VKHSNLYRIAVEGILLCGWILLFCSAASFDIADPPSDYAWPHNQPVKNWIGPAGALAAYYMHNYIGPGVLLGLFACIWMLITHLSGKEISQPVLRVIGMLLLVAAASTTWYLLWPVNTAEYGVFYQGALGWVYNYQVIRLPGGVLAFNGDEFPMGNGGIIGHFAGELLKQKFALLGSVIVLCCTWLVGAVLLADSLVLAVVRWFGDGVMKFFGVAGPAIHAAREQSAVLGDIWKRLSEKQKARGDGSLRDIKLPNRIPLGRTQPKVSLIPSAQEPQAHDQTELGEGQEQTAGVVGEQTAVETAGEGDGVETQDTQQAEAKAPAAKPLIKPRPAPRPKQPEYKPATYDDYQLPPLDLLKDPEKGFAAVQGKMVEEKAQILEGLLNEFGINAQVVNAEPGPAITMYELQLAPGIKVNQISNLANDMARALGSGTVRVVAPLPGKHTIGIEVPNS